MKRDVAELLKEEAKQRNSFGELSADKPDPLMIAKKYNDEYIALICALFAYGNAKLIVKFLDNIQGPSKLIEKFKVVKIEQDPNQKDRVLLDIHITPYFPAKSFVIQLDGHKGDGPEKAEWHSEYNQV